ncbi:MarR family transcriptional regulator [Metabacillus sp. GX 13764]|uniref:MarR family winged helix-turn-helix transcriptional regulator n=1 Tax=Metabacillus kandeliae TaxID=2900151 RepID=UPI001E356416|nr:MarR family transcriptional regulator [Metabacillus kandeliae]MCD7035647.1 MarR family transcriptional regulator [Metabacillus kandeliae]
MDTEDFLKLEDHLCFSLYAGSRAVMRLYRPYLEELNLTYPQYLVLLVLAEKNSRSVKEIGELLDLDSGTLTPMLKRMEAANLVKRSRSKQDERVVTVSLTEEGQAVQKKTGCIPTSLFTSTGLPEDELRDLNASIKKLLEKLEE